MALSIDIETPLQDDVSALFSELNTLLSSLTPEEHCHHLTADEMATPQTSLFVVRDKGEAVACGALHRHKDNVGEIKRMFTRPSVQGQGIGKRVLNQIIDLANAERLDRLVLETGNNFDAAIHLYKHAGFRSCGPILDYPDSPYTVFYTKPLRESAEI